MCGIAGLIKYGHGEIASEIKAMRDVFPYRGPDDKGSWIHPNQNLALGHRRLSILDPTPAGRQPMHDADNGLTIVFNGEIYNYLEIRRELRGLGHHFATGTDTEVILKAFAEWGEDCLHRFNGMFAIAVWQEKEQRLFITRDRLGIKPFYYFESPCGFYFASEMKAILAVLPESLSVQDELIDSYMSFGYVPGEDTLLMGIKRLLPGHYMFKGLSPEPGLPQKYWHLDFAVGEDKGEDYYLENTRSLLNSAIDLRLRSDVPLGIFLSGGLDSSSVVGLLAPRVQEPLKTFSVAYDFGSQFNETPYARLVAEKFNTDHHEIFITPADFRNFIPQFIYLMDEPVTESAAIALYYVSKLAKEQVTVVLSGEGSDEIFGGYDLYQYMGVLEKYYNIAGPFLTGLLAGIGSRILPPGHKLAKYLFLGAQPLELRYKGISTYEERSKERLYNSDFAVFCRDRKKNAVVDGFLTEIFMQSRENDVLSRMLDFDIRTWLVDDLLIKADRMSMAASLELRVPFLDYRLVEFAAAMPSKYKIRQGQGKYLLKKLMEGILPKEIIYRKKMGFPTPLKMMFEGELYGYARDVLLSSSSRLSTYFSPSGIDEILREHKERKMDHHRLIWQLIVLDQWLAGVKGNIVNGASVKK